jgi:hypothetical protein
MIILMKNIGCWNAVGFVRREVAQSDIVQIARFNIAQNVGTRRHVSTASDKRRKKTMIDTQRHKKIEDVRTNTDIAHNSLLRQ